MVTGENFPDALTASVLAAGGPFPLVPVRRDSVPAPSERYITDHRTAITNLFVVGGTSAVSNATTARIQWLLP